MLCSPRELRVQKTVKFSHDLHLTSPYLTQDNMVTILSHCSFYFKTIMVGLLREPSPGVPASAPHCSRVLAPVREQPLLPPVLHGRVCAPEEQMSKEARVVQWFLSLTPHGKEVWDQATRVPVLPLRAEYMLSIFITYVFFKSSLFYHFGFIKQQCVLLTFTFGTLLLMKK